MANSCETLDERVLFKKEYFEFIIQETNLEVKRMFMLVDLPPEN